MYFKMSTHIFHDFDKYISKFQQMYFKIWTQMFSLTSAIFSCGCFGGLWQSGWLRMLPPPLACLLACLLAAPLASIRAPAIRWRSGVPPLSPSSFSWFLILSLIKSDNKYQPPRQSDQLSKVFDILKCTWKEWFIFNRSCWIYLTWPEQVLLHQSDRGFLLYSLCPPQCIAMGRRQNKNTIWDRCSTVVLKVDCQSQRRYNSQVLKLAF